jgi:DNA-binding transcriptional MerR regulator
MPYKETEIQKLYYTISEVAAIFNVNASLIRFWEKEFELVQPKKNKKGNRLFTLEDVETYRLIFHLVRERGYTLQGAKTKLKENKADTQNNMQLVNSLKEIKKFLLELKEEL